MVATSSSSGSGPRGDIGQCRTGDWIALGSLRLDCRRLGNRFTWVGLRPGPAVGRADVLLQGRPKRLPGACRATSWLTLTSVRVTCAAGKGAGAWTADAAPEDDAAPVDEPEAFALQTMTQQEINSEFRAWPGRMPQLAQWLQIEQPRVVSEVGFTIGFTENATAGWWADQGRWDLATVTRSGTVPGNFTVSLWRKNDPGPPPSGFDLSSGFTLVGQSAPIGPIPMGANIIPFTRPLALDSGTYVLVIDFRSDDPDVLMISVDGHQHGDSHIGADGQPNPCVYTPARDVYPQGAVYRTDSPWITPVRGQQWPQSTKFAQVKGKVLECGVIGQYTDIFNPGDLRVGFN